MAQNFEEIKEEIRARNDIVDVIENYGVSVKKAGGRFKALCPFHNEKTPSFNIDHNHQSYKCFGCGVHGDIFSFVQETEKVDFMTAMELLASRCGLQIDLKSSGPPGQADKKKKLLKIMDAACSFYQRILNESKAGEIARQYNEDRGLNQELCQEFRIGYAPDSWDAILKWGEKHKYSVPDLEACGLITKKDDNAQKTYDRFRKRLMFPILDKSGNVVGFSGRLLEDDVKAAKYVNSPETLLFKKSNILYGIDKAMTPIGEKRTALLAEGQIDVIKCHAHGFKHTVAAQGTAITDDHARMLSRLADEIILILDADAAGKKAAMRSAPIFFKFALDTKVAVLPEGEDPDTFLSQKGAEAFQAELDNAISLIDFMIEALLAEEGSASDAGIMRVSSKILESIKECDHAIFKERLMTRVSERLDISEAALQSELEKKIKKSSYQLRAKENVEQVTYPASSPQDYDQVPLEAYTDEYVSSHNQDPGTPEFITYEEEPPAPYKSSVQMAAPDELIILELLLHYPETRPLFKSYLDENSLFIPEHVTLYSLLTETANSRDFTEIIASISPDEEKTRELLSMLMLNCKSKFEEAKEAMTTAQEIIIQRARKSLEQKRKEIDVEKLEATGSRLEELTIERDQLNHIIMKLKMAPRSLSWDDALPILDLYLDGAI